MLVSTVMFRCVCVWSTARLTPCKGWLGCLARSSPHPPSPRLSPRATQLVEPDTAGKDDDKTAAGGRRLRTVHDTELVVGDRFVLHEGMVLPCDIILVAGRVVVDESMLTGTYAPFTPNIASHVYPHPPDARRAGESIPVQKLPVDFAGVPAPPEEGDAVLDGCRPVTSLRPVTSAAGRDGGGGDDVEKGVAFGSEDGAPAPRPVANAGELLAEKYPGSVLFGGTRVKHCVHGRADSVGTVYRTGYRSAKGQLVSSLLEPREGFLDFFNDMLWVIFAMFFLASVLFIYQVRILAPI